MPYLHGASEHSKCNHMITLGFQGLTVSISMWAGFHTVWNNSNISECKLCIQFKFVK